MDYTPDHLNGITNLAQGTAAVDSVARQQKRLSQSRTPSTQRQSQTWVDWGGAAGVLGQPFDTDRIPMSKLEQMRRDSMLAFGLSMCKIPLVRAPWYIKSTDARRAAFVDNALRRIYGRLILAYTNCFDYGFSPIVKRFEYAQPDWTYVDYADQGSVDPSAEKPVWADPKNPALVWKPFMPLNPRKTSPHWNAAGEFAGIDFNSTGSGADYYGWSGSDGFPWLPTTSNSAKSGRPGDIPLDWALWATNEKDSKFGSIFGYPRLGYAYRYWWSYWYEFGLSDRAFEKWADPPVIAYHPDIDGIDADGNKVDYTDIALGLAEDLRSGANVSMPTSVVRGDMDKATTLVEWRLEQMQSNANFDALNGHFEYLDVMKLRAVMVPEQALIEGKGGTSSRNVASTFGDLFQESQAIVMEEIDALINEYVIPQLVEANFGPGGPSCTKVTTGFDPQDIETMRLIVTGFANSTSPVMPVDLRTLLERLGIPVLSHAAHQQQLDVIAEQAAKMKPPPTPSTSGPGKSAAGVSNLGQYYDPQESINLDVPIVEKDTMTIEEHEERTLGLFQKMLSVFRREEKEPQNLHVTFDVEVEEPDPQKIEFSFVSEEDESSG